MSPQTRYVLLIAALTIAAVATAVAFPSTTPYALPGSVFVLLLALTLLPAASRSGWIQVEWPQVRR